MELIYFNRCNSCNKYINKNKDDYITATKNGITVLFCKNHIKDCLNFMKYFNEFIDIKEKI